MTRLANGIRLATWNIHSGIGSDERMDMDRVVSVIDAIEPDIIGLQEVGWHRSHHSKVDQFAFLREKTGYHVAKACRATPALSVGNAL